MHVWTTNRYLTSVRKTIGYYPLIGFTASFAILFFNLFVGLAGLSVFGYLLFNNTMNILQGVGPVYWITRNNSLGATPFISMGIMREVGPPWRVGKGLQITVKPYAFQLGVCRKESYNSVEEGELGALGARYMDETPKELGTWK